MKTFKIHHKKTFSAKLLAAVKVLFLIGLITGIGLSALLYYGRGKFEQWQKENRIESTFKSFTLHWQEWERPEIVLHTVILHSVDSDAFFQGAEIKQLSIQLNLKVCWQYYLKGYQIDVQANELTIKSSPGLTIKAKQLSGCLMYSHHVYKAKNLNTDYVQLDLPEAYSTPATTSHHTASPAHLIIYKIFATAEYSVLTNHLKVEASIPSAHRQMPKNRVYSLKTAGEIHFLSEVTPPLIPAKGKFTFTINHFSHFLRHLYQAKMISSLAANLGTIVGYPITKEALFNQNKEIFTNAVTLDLKIEDKGIYIGPLKIYP